MQFSAPHGPAWVFFGVVFVIAVFPWLAERVRVPGIIGLLLGGLLLGQNGLGVVPAGDLVIPAVGHIGLLYLMFLAGVEIDLARPHDRAELAVDLDGAEGLVVVSNRGEDAACLKHRGEIELVHRAVREGEAQPTPVQGLDTGDCGPRRGHGSGAMGSGWPGAWRLSELVRGTQMSSCQGTVLRIGSAHPASEEGNPVVFPRLVQRPRRLRRVRGLDSGPCAAGVRRNRDREKGWCHSLDDQREGGDAGQARRPRIYRSVRAPELGADGRMVRFEGACVRRHEHVLARLTSGLALQPQGAERKPCQGRVQGPGAKQQGSAGISGHPALVHAWGWASAARSRSCWRRRLVRDRPDELRPSRLTHDVLTG